MAEKTFKIVMSDRCFRFKPDAIPGHAPASPGVYEFVTFDEHKRAEVLFVGLALDATVQQCLVEHMMDKRKPTADDLFAKHKDVYFDFVARSTGQGAEDLKDIAAALIAKHKPAFNTEPSPSTGRFKNVQLEEVEIL